MENQNKTFMLHCLKYGLILSGIMILLQLLTYVFSIDMTSTSYSLLYQLITLIAIVWIMAYTAIKFRDKYLDNKISFLRCFLAGLIVGLVSTIIVSLYTYCFNVLFDPAYANEIIQKSIEKIDTDPRIPDSQKEYIINKITENSKPGVQLWISLASSTVMTIITSLIATLFVRKKEKQPETNTF